MSDIFEQIQDLNNKFSTLFEVEGLGDPSQEVPPSTNKLKKDVKTKNGKVELVSVENELFPYEGNKKEQFQQKVLDTINGMIQGTKTLEDLLQVVRQKKAPLKEAVEILEELINEVSDKTAQAALDKAKERYYRKGYEASMKLFQGDSKGAIEDGNKAQDEYNKHINMQQRRAKREGKKLVQDKNDHDSFKIEEALKLLEDLESTITKKYGPMFGGKTTPKGHYLHGKAIQAKYDELTDAARRNLPDEKKNSISALDDEMGKINRNRLKTKNKTGEHKTDVRSRSYKRFTDDWGFSKTDDDKVEGSIRRNQEKKAKLKEALSLIEEIINEVSTDLLKAAAIKSAEDRKEELIGKGNDYDKYPSVNAAKELRKAEDRYAHAQALADMDMKTDTKVPANKLFKAASKSLEGREVDKASKKYKRATELATNDPVASRREENIKGINKRFIDSFKKNTSSEALEEAIKILEGLFINDGRGDILDDLTGTKMTGMQRINKGVKKLIDMYKKKQKAAKKANK